MKRLFAAIAIALLAFGAAAQEAKKEAPPAKEPEYNTNKEFRSRVFEIHNRNADDIASSIKLLGSGFKGASISVNSRLGTITARDFPENIATMEEAIKRLDKPAPLVPDVELKVSILIASKSPIAGAAPVGDDLAPVVRELQSALRYSNYALMTTTVHRTRPGVWVDNSGVADATAIGLKVPESTPVTYGYSLRESSLITSGDKPALNVAEFRFDMKFPIAMGSPASLSYQSVGFKTPLTIRDGQKVVVGTTSMGDRALIVVLEGTFGK